MLPESVLRALDNCILTFFFVAKQDGNTASSVATPTIQQYLTKELLRRKVCVIALFSLELWSKF